MCVLSLIFHCIIVAQGEQSVKGSIMKNLSYFDTTWNLSVLNTDWVQDEKNKVINASKKITGCLNARLLLHSAISDEDAWGFVTHLRGYFYPNIHFFFPHWREMNTKVTGLQFLTCPKNLKQAM